MAPKRTASSPSPSASFGSNADRGPTAVAAATISDAPPNPSPNPNADASANHNPDSFPLAPAAADGGGDDSDADSNPPKPSRSFSVSDPDGAADPADDADADADLDGAADDDEVSSDAVPAGRPRGAAELSVVPISTRPMDSDAAATPPRSSKPRMKRPRTNLHPSASEPRRPVRVWSTVDEIAILRGLVNYRDQHRGALPSSAQDISVLHSNIRHLLGTKGTTSQLSDKIRRLKQKYTALASRVKKYRAANFATSHEQNLYELGKKIWGGKKTNSASSNAVAAATGAAADNENNIESEREDSRDSEKEEEERKSHKSRKMRVVAANGHRAENNNGKEGYAPDDNAKETYPYLWEAVQEIAKENTSVALFTRAVEVLEGAKARTMEEKLRKFRMSEARQQLRRMDLMKETAKLVLDALERSE